MLNWRKFIVTGALATTLTFSSLSAMAVSFDDVSSNEASISKLVSLGIVVNKGANFNPENELTRQEFADIAGRIMTVKASKTVKLNTKNAAAVKVVGAGILTVGKNGDFKPKNAITYSDLARGLAYGLGFKASWTNDMADYLYFLERKGVLSIDTDLDAVVTREEAALAIDNYMKAKDSYNISTGIVDRIIGGNTIVIKTESGNKSYKISSNVSIFLGEQYGEVGNIARGTIIHLTLNKKGEVAFAEGNGLDMMDGKLSYSGGNLTLNGVAKNFLLNGLVSSLPNSRTVPFTFTEFSNYAAKAGVSFDGGLYVDAVTDEITILEPYITKVAKRDVTVENNKVVFDFSGVALKSQSFEFASDAKITLLETVKDENGKETSTPKEVTLADIAALQAAGKKFTGTLTAGADGFATAIEFAEDVEE